MGGSLASETMRLFFLLATSLSIFALTACGSSDEEPSEGEGGAGGAGGAGGCPEAYDFLHGGTAVLSNGAETFFDFPVSYTSTPATLSGELKALDDGGSCSVFLEVQPILPISEVFSTVGREDFEVQEIELETGSLRSLRISAELGSCEFRRLTIRPECGE